MNTLVELTAEPVKKKEKSRRDKLKAGIFKLPPKVRKVYFKRSFDLRRSHFTFVLKFSIKALCKKSLNLHIRKPAHSDIKPSNIVLRNISGLISLVSPVNI